MCIDNRRNNTAEEMTSWVPEACTLPTVEQPVRVAEFDELFATLDAMQRRADAARTDGARP